jgi:hypothetical protein
MPPGRPPMSTTTRLYGIFVDSTGQRPMTVPALFNALFDRHGIDAIFVPFQVTAAHVAAAIAVALALAGVGALTITNRTQPETDALAQRSGAPLLFRPASISSSMRPPWGNRGRGGGRKHAITIVQIIPPA